MPRFEFRYERSEAPQDQIPGLTVSVAECRAAVTAKKMSEALELIAKILIVPGTYIILIHQPGKPLSQYKAVKPLKGKTTVTEVVQFDHLPTQEGK